MLDSKHTLGRLALSAENDVGIKLALILHTKALCAHIEALAMNAENCVRASLNQEPVYRDSDYFAILQKWGLTKDTGERKSILDMLEEEI